MINSVSLYKTCYTENQFPKKDRKEIAFAGRSNVGKSSLLNAMFNKKLAKTSSKPGKTQSVNFFLVNDSIYFVDLPGYGFAKVSKSEKEKWNRLMEDYFKNRSDLDLVVLLIDSRHLLQKNDQKMIEWINYYEIPFIIALTKTDKLSKNGINKAITYFKKTLKPVGPPAVFPVSSLKKEGLEDLTRVIF